MHMNVRPQGTTKGRLPVGEPIPNAQQLKLPFPHLSLLTPKTMKGCNRCMFCTEHTFDPVEQTRQVDICVRSHWFFPFYSFSTYSPPNKYVFTIMTTIQIVDEEEYNSDDTGRWTPATTMDAEPKCGAILTGFTSRKNRLPGAPSVTSGEASFTPKGAMPGFQIVDKEKDPSDHISKYGRSTVDPKANVGGGSSIEADMKSARAALQTSAATQSQRSSNGPGSSGMGVGFVGGNQSAPAGGIWSQPDLPVNTHSGSVAVTPLHPATSTHRSHHSKLGQMSGSTQRKLNQDKHDQDW